MAFFFSMSKTKSYSEFCGIFRYQEQSNASVLPLPGACRGSMWMSLTLLLIFNACMFYFSAILEKQDSIIRKMLWQKLQCFFVCFFFKEICTEFFPSVPFNVYETSMRSREEKRVAAYWHSLNCKGYLHHLMGFQSFTKMSISVERCWNKSWIPFETRLMLT